MIMWIVLLESSLLPVLATTIDETESDLIPYTEYVEEQLLNADAQPDEQFVSGLSVDTAYVNASAADDAEIVSFLGDSVSTYLGYTQYGTGGNYYNESNMAVEDTWWSQVLMKNGWKLGVNESLGGSRVSWDGVTEDGSFHVGPKCHMASKERMEQLSANGIPDKIVIFGGLNDVLAQDEVTIGHYQSGMEAGKVDTFANAYYTMITGLQTQYPDAEIICMTPYDTVYSFIGDAADRLAESTKEVHDIILAICKEKNIQYVDIYQGVMLQAPEDFCQDMIHPNEKGMAKISGYVNLVLEQNHGFVTEGDDIYYFDESGNIVSNCWKSIDDELYYFNADGTVKRDEWSELLDGSKCYLDEDGKLVHDSFRTIDKKIYYFNEFGALYTKTRLEREDGNLYFTNKDGSIRQNQFFCDGIYTYYLQNDGSAMKNRLTYHPNGKEIIYFDDKGHEVFDSFVNVKHSIEGNPVDDICYFNTFGYMYVDQTTFTTDKQGVQRAYYINAYGVVQSGGWFKYANGVDVGYANWDNSLIYSQWSFDLWGRPVYFHADGKIAKGTLYDGTYRYELDENDGHLLSKTLMTSSDSGDGKNTKDNSTKKDK